VSVAIKICGLSEPKTLAAAIEAGAAFVGFNFFRRSPRFVSTDVAADLVDRVPRGTRAVGLFADPRDSDIEAVLKAVRLDVIQLHGHETSDRVAAVRNRFALPVMKAIGVSGPRDVIAAAAYDKVADWLLFDAKPPPDATRPGGNARPFDWPLLRTYTGALPWLLAGGLTRANVASAIKASGANAVDVSSGVETRPGVKSAAKIRAFVAAVRAAA
jgi:phosphoribosylanthranilate isomerase